MSQIWYGFPGPGPAKPMSLGQPMIYTRLLVGIRERWLLFVLGWCSDGVKMVPGILIGFSLKLGVVGLR